MKPAFKHNGRSYFIDSFDIRRATIKAFEFPKDVIGKNVFRFVTDHDYLKGVGLDGLPSDTFINPEFTKLLKLLSDDTEFHNLVQHLQQYYDDLFDCIKITEVELINKNGERFKILTENLRDASNASIYHRYIHTPVHMSEDTIHKAIENGNHIEN